MKKLVKWLVKKYVTNEAVKSAVHGMNASFAAKVKVEGKEKVADVANDVLACVSARIEGYSDDGRIDEAEMVAINAQDDALINKYLSDGQLAALIDKLFA